MSIRTGLTGSRSGTGEGVGDRPHVPRLRWTTDPLCRAPRLLRLIEEQRLASMRRHRLMAVLAAGVVSVASAVCVGVPASARDRLHSATASANPFGDGFRAWSDLRRPLTATARRTVLSVRVEGLPTAVPAAVVVVGPHHFRRKITHVGVAKIRLPRAGRYRVRVRPVSFASAIGGAQKGAVAHPVRARHSVFIRAGRRRSVTASYGTVVNPGLVVLSGRTARIIGDPNHPQALVLTGIRAVPRVGQVMSAAPSASLPIGLLARVTSVAGTANALTVGVQSVPVTDVVPVLQFDSRATAASAAQTRVAADPSCTGSGISPYLQLSHFRLSGSIQAVSWTGPHVTLEAHFDVNTGVNITAAVGFDCSFSINSIPLRAVVPPGIPVYGVLTGHVDVVMQTAATLKAGVSIPVTAGGRSIGVPPALVWAPVISFENPKIVHLFTRTTTISAGAGVGAEIGVGDPDAGNLHLAEDNGLDFTAHPQSCSWDLNLGSFSGGGKLGPFSVSTPSTPPLYHRNLWTGCTPHSERTYFYNNRQGWLVRPRTLDFCSTGCEYDGLSWRGWDTPIATGKGFYAPKTSDPRVNGRWPVVIKLSRRRRCPNHRLIYTRYEETLTGKLPPWNPPRVRRMNWGCDGYPPGTAP